MSQSFWYEETPTGKVKFVRRYRDPQTNKLRRVSTTRKKYTKIIEREAYEFLGQRIEEKLNELSGDNMTVEELFDEWYEVYKQQVKPSTLMVVNSMIEPFLTRYCTRFIGDITSGMINQYTMYLLSERGLSYGSCIRYMAPIKLAFKHAYVMEYIDNNPLDKLYIPKINLTDKSDFKYLEIDELEDIVQQLNDMGYHDFARLAQIQALTGARVGELLAINYKDHFNANKQELLIAGTYNRRNHTIQTTKTGKTRLLHINSKTIKLLAEQIHATNKKMLRHGIRNPNNLLFITSGGLPYTVGRINDVLQKVDCSKHLTSHIFRHTFITRMVEAGVDNKLIAEHVGHSSTDMVEQVYSHFTELMDQRLKQAIEDVKII